MDCLFCKILRKEIPAEIVGEGDEYFAFLDVRPRAPGHTMVIPKEHAETILDLPDEKTQKLFIGVKKVADRLKRALNPDGFTVGINHGEASGQTVEHLHVHILPRFQKDGGGSVHSVVNNPPAKPLSEIAKQIRDNHE